jgi:hypothetical protein
MAIGFVGAAALQSAWLFPSRKNRSFSRICSSSFPVPLRIRRKQVRSNPAESFLFLFGRRHLRLYRCSSAMPSATETPKSTRTSVDAPLIATIFVLACVLVPTPIIVKAPATSSPDYRTYRELTHYDFTAPLDLRHRPRYTAVTYYLAIAIANRPRT